ncbi:MAG: hypothetical protein AAGE94_10605 [Acidobacteriota bacterium]
MISSLPSLRRALFAAALLGTFTVGCTAHVHPTRHHHDRHHHHDQGKVVVVRKGHVHHHACGHYRHQGRWYHLERHVHGKRCGHVRVRGVWVSKR